MACGGKRHKLDVVLARVVRDRGCRRVARLKCVKLGHMVSTGGIAGVARGRRAGEKSAHG